MAFCGAAAAVSGRRLGVCVGNSCSWPKPTGLLGQPGSMAHTLFFLLGEGSVLCTRPRSPGIKKKDAFIPIPDWEIHVGLCKANFSLKLSTGWWEPAGLVLLENELAVETIILHAC